MYKLLDRKFFIFFFIFFCLLTAGLFYTNLFNFLNADSSYYININDTQIYHKEAINILVNFDDILNYISQNQITISFNVWFRSLIYFLFGTNPIYLIVINALVCSFIIFYLHNILNLLQITSNYSYFFFLIVLCIFPSSIYLLIVNGKDLYVTLFSLMIIYIFLYFYSINKDTYSFFFKITFFFLPFISLFLISMRASVVLYLTVIFIFTLLSSIKFIILKKINYYHILFGLILILAIILYYLLKSYLPFQSGLSHSEISLSLALYKANSNMIFEWNDFQYFPNFFNNVLYNLSSFRENFMNYQLLVSSNTPLYSNVHPSGSLEALKHLTSLYFKAPLLPGFDYWINAKSFNEFIISFESLISYILFSSLVINYKKLSIHEIYIIFFSISFMVIYLYTAPNLGSFIRYRYLAYLLLLLISFKHWIIIIKLVLGYFLLNVSLSTNIDRTTTSNISLFNIKNLTSIILSMVILIIVTCRDIFFINSINIGGNSQIYLIILAFLTFFQNSFNNPIIDYKGVSLKHSKASNLHINFIYFFSLFVFHFFHKEIFLLFDIYITNKNLYLIYFLISLFLVTLNYLAEFSYKYKLNQYYYVQIIIQLITLLCFIIIGDFTIKSILISFIVATVLGIIIMALLLKNKNIFFTKINLLHFKINNLFNKTFIKILSIQFINNFCFLSIYYLTLKYFADSTFYLFAYKIIFSLAFFISNLGSVLLLPNLFNLSDKEKNVSLEIYIKYFFLIGIIINFLIFFISIFIQPIFYYLFFESSIQLSHSIGQSFIICSTVTIIIALNLITQKILLSDKKYNILIISNSITLLLFLAIIFIDLDLNTYFLNFSIYICFLIATCINVIVINKVIKNAMNLIILILFSFVFSLFVILGVHLNNTILLNIVLFGGLFLAQSYIKRFIN